MEPGFYSDSLYCMGTFLEIVVPGEELDGVSGAVKEALREAADLERQMSRFDPESEISLVNSYAAQRPVKVAQDLFQLLELAVRYAELTGGAFDITVGPLIDAWNGAKTGRRTPGEHDIQQALRLVGSRRLLELDSRRCTVRFKRRGMKIDLGGIGKGYAVDRVVAVLKRHGIREAFVNFGSSSIYALGSPPGENHWVVTVTHPRDGNEIHELELENAAVSSSGQNPWPGGGAGELPHIINPGTGYPSPATRRVTVTSPSAVESEVLSTAIQVAGPEKGRQIMEKFGNSRAILFEERPGGDLIAIENSTVESNTQPTGGAQIERPG